MRYEVRVFQSTNALEFYLNTFKHIIKDFKITMTDTYIVIVAELKDEEA